MSESQPFSTKHFSPDWPTLADGRSSAARTSEAQRRHLVTPPDRSPPRDFEYRDAADGGRYLKSNIYSPQKSLIGHKSYGLRPCCI
jgi:hypothetical protein